MRKRKTKGPGSDAQRVEFESRPDMLNLDAALREVLKVPKEEMDRREQEWQKQRSERKKPG